LYVALVAVLTLVVGLAVNYAAHGIVRDVLVRVYQALYAAANAIPQPFYLAFLILVVLLSAARSLLGDEGGLLRQRQEPAGGRVAEWRERLERAAQPAPSQRFYRWRVARDLARLAGEIVAHQKGISPGEAERQIEDGDVVLPSAIQSYFLASIRSRPARSGSRWERLSHTQPPGPFDLDPAEAVDWIETIAD
jgi:hypothetical protein